MDSMEFLETETGDNPVGCVIWMHGLGADAT
jgi:predicted esterase